MNIFYLDNDPYVACTYLMDVHVRKMILETCQLLMTTDVLHGCDRPYKPTHINHPCRLALENVNNYSWLCRYFKCICNEFVYRFGHHHVCETYCDMYYHQPMHICNPTFPQCMPDVFKRSSVIAGYRAYYQNKYHLFSLRGIAGYTGRMVPYWLYNLY